MEHTDRLEEIDKEQREKEAQNNDVDDAKVFAETVYEAATPPKGEPAIPLLSQEEMVTPSMHLRTSAFLLVLSL